MYKELSEEQNLLVNRLFVAREEQRASDMQRYWANVYAPTNKINLVYELFGISIQKFEGGTVFYSPTTGAYEKK